MNTTNTWILMLTTSGLLVWSVLTARLWFKLKRQAKNVEPTEVREVQHQEQSVHAARTRYLSAISHELRTPLNVIMGYAQFLENQSKDQDPHREKYTLMRQNCEHLAHLIEGILEFSAIESGRLKVQTEALELKSLLQQVSATFHNQARQKGLSFHTDIDPRLPQTVKTDPKRFQQILLNLLSNAIKFTDTGSVSLHVTYRNQVATFTVADTGCGIHPADSERIFQPFERIEQQHKTVPGTGLGLPITQMLVGLLGGELTVKSEPGKGSSFSFKLMLAPSTAVNTEQQKTADEAQHQPPETQQQYDLLVVDDLRSHRNLLVDVLKPHPLRLSTAANGLEAQSMLQKQTYHLAIIDVAMPEMDGWTLAHWINEYQPQTKIIMLSGNPRDAEQSHKANYDAYLSKPVQVGPLLRAIYQALCVNQGGQQDRSKPLFSGTAISLLAKDRQALENMSEIGHINGIEQYLSNMLSEQRIDPTSYQRLKEPIKNMNMSQFRSLLQDDNN